MPSSSFGRGLSPFSTVIPNYALGFSLATLNQNVLEGSVPSPKGAPPLLCKGGFVRSNASLSLLRPLLRPLLHVLSLAAAPQPNPRHSERAARFFLPRRILARRAAKRGIPLGMSWVILGWVGLGWVGLGWVGLGWVGLGWVGLGWVGLGWVGLGWVGLGWVRLGCLGLGCLAFLFLCATLRTLRLCVILSLLFLFLTFNLQLSTFNLLLPPSPSPPTQFTWHHSFFV